MCRTRSADASGEVADTPALSRPRSSEESRVVVEDLAQFDQVPDGTGDIDRVRHGARPEIKDGELSLWLSEELSNVQLLAPLRDTKGRRIVVKILRRASVASEPRSLHPLFDALRGSIEIDRETELKREHHVARTPFKLGRERPHDRTNRGHIARLFNTHKLS